MFTNMLRGRNTSVVRMVVTVLATGVALGLLSFSTLHQDKFQYVDAVGSGRQHIEEVLSSHDKNEVHHLGEDTEAQRLKEQVKVLCWVMTCPKSHLRKAKHVKATWGKRCNKLIFMSSENDTELPAIDLNAGEGRDYLWGKTRAAFKYVYEHYLNDYDWFFKGDDDTYVIMENMRYMLSPYEPDYPIYFGSRFKMFSKHGYMSGGGGYVLSREAVRQFVEKAIPNGKICKTSPHGAEDAEIGKCLGNIGVLAGDSRDSLGRGRFFPFDPVTHLDGRVPYWYKQYVYYKPDTGLNCCSDTPVTFHYINTRKMYELEYLLYHARPYGIVHHDPFPASLPQDKQSIPKNILEKYEPLGSAEVKENKTQEEKLNQTTYSSEKNLTNK